MERKTIVLVVLAILLSGTLHAQQTLKTVALSTQFNDLAGTPRVVRNTIQDVWLTAWRQGDRILGRVVRSDGIPGNTRVLATGVSSSANSFDIEYDSQKNRYVLVSETAQGLQVRFFTPALAKVGSVIPVQGSLGGTSPRVVKALVFWVRDGSTLMSAVLNPATQHALVQAGSGKSFSALRVSRNPLTGNVLALVLRSESGGRASLLGYSIASDGTLERNTPLIFQPSSSGLQSTANAAFDDNGTGFAAWSFGAALKFRKISPSGTLSAPARSLLNVADDDSLHPALVFDRSGERFIAVWPAGSEIRIVAWNSAGSIRTPTQAIAASLLGHSRNAAASVDSQQGNVLAVWEDASEAGSAAQGSFQVRAALFFPGSAGGETTVTVGDNFFSPKNITIAAGSVVSWTNVGFNPHTVTSGTPVSQVGMVFDSGSFNHDQKFTFRFTQVGSIPYFCRVHGSVQSGTISVVDRAR